MRTSLAILILLVPIGAALAAAPRTPAGQCSAANVVDCETLKNSDRNLSGKLGFPAAKDGTYLFNSWALLNRKRVGDNIHPFEPKDEIFLDHMNASSPGRKKATLDLAERIRREAIEMLRGDVRTEALSAEEKKERDAQIKRLETLQFKFVSESENKCSREVPLGFPNAAYREFSHTIEFCPAVASQTNEWIVRTLAHEIGHPLGPCNENAALYKVDASKANRSELRDCDEEFVEGEDSPGSVYKEYLPYLKQLSEGQLSYMSGDDDVLRSLANCGIINSVPDGAPGGSRLFASTQLCLVKQNATRYSQLIEALAEEDRAYGLTRTNAQANARRNNPERCFGRTVEHFADSFGARLFNQIAEKDHYDANQVKAAFIDFAGYACASQAGQFEDTFAYPPGDLRLRVFTSGNYVSSRLGCEPPPPRDGDICSLESTTNAQSNAQTNAPAKTQTSSPAPRHKKPAKASR